MKILLVDDEQPVLNGISRMLECEQDEWEIATALSGSQALQHLENTAFDVVVTDMIMPGMDGDFPNARM